jgi:hypothetical protein
MAGRDGALGHPDVAAVCPAPVEAHQVLRPFPGEAEILIAVRWSDADHGAVRRDVRHSWDAIPEVRRGLKAADVGRLAVRAPRLVGAVPGRLALDVRQACPEVRSGGPAVFAAAVQYKRAVDRFAA